MNKIKRTVASVLLIALAVTSLAGCGLFSGPTYTANSGFFYSSDKGHTYGDGTKEYAVGETVYMKVKFKVTSDSKKTSQVKVVLSIPNVQNVDPQSWRRERQNVLPGCSVPVCSAGACSIPRQPSGQTVLQTQACCMQPDRLAGAQIQRPLR